MKDQIDLRVATVESDMRRAHEEDKAADLQLRDELNALSAPLSEGQDQLANSIAALSAAFGRNRAQGQLLGLKPRLASRRPSTRLLLKPLGFGATYALSEGAPTMSALPPKSSGSLSSGWASP